MMAIDSNKFTPEGQVKPYYGNTIIAPYGAADAGAEGRELIALATAVQERFRQSALAPKLAFLPPESFHTTIYSLMRVIDRGTSRWPAWLSQNYQQFREVDMAVQERIRDIPLPAGLQVRCCAVLPHKLLLEGASPEDERQLRHCRDLLAQRMGIHESGHQDYRFHISLAYPLACFTPEEEALATELGQELLAAVQARLPQFSLPRPRFVLFNDMYAYHEDLAARGTLY